jgi:hypothetical protein
MDWLLAYLLFGFVVSWIGSNIMHIKPNESWRWELAATVLWPFTVLCAVIYKGRKTVVGGVVSHD